MLKLISIKRPFVNKTEHIKNEDYKKIATLMKNAEIDCAQVAKIASKLKRILKSSDAEKMYEILEKAEDLNKEGKEPDPKDVELHNKLHDKLNSKIDPLTSQLYDITEKSIFFQHLLSLDKN